MSKTAMISGARGQDASYLAELLLEKGYKVVAFERRTGSPDYSNIQHLLQNPNYILERGDITDQGSISRLVREYKPDEFYNIAAQSFVGASWDQPVATCDINFMGVVNCLEAIRLMSSNTKFFQASTSEVYGDVTTETQNELTSARPRSPYAAAKYGAESIVKVYRDSYGIFACFARSFNHESPRRGKEFVTRKITNAVAEMWKTVVGTELPVAGQDNQRIFDEAISKGAIEPIPLGNHEARRDWSHAKDVVRGMWMMMQQDEPNDYVLCSGISHSIGDLLKAAFSVIGVSDVSNYSVVDPRFYRPADVNILLGDASRAKNDLDWETDISFEEMIKDMVLSDIKGHDARK